MKQAFIFKIWLEIIPNISVSFIVVGNAQPKFTYTVGTYSPGKLSVVYDISIHVLPTVPSPTTTHLIGLPEDIVDASWKTGMEWLAKNMMLHCL